MIKPIKFYDTSTLLNIQEKAFDEPFIISKISLLELENIKVSANKDFEIKAKARNIVRLLDQNMGKYEVCLEGKEECIKLEFDLTNDNQILAGALACNKTSPILFFSDDILLRLLARNAGLEVKSSKDILETEVEYLGYKEAFLSDDELAFYFEDLRNGNTSKNTYACLVNEYLIIRNKRGDVKDIKKWNGEQFIEVVNKSIKSTIFGSKIKAKDEYQQMAIDSLMNNTMTILSGKAGSGKTLLCLAAAMNLIEAGKYDKIVVLYNPTKAKGASDGGFFPGTNIEKAMQSSIGEILCSKFGDRYQIDIMIQQNKLKLLSMADCRGTEVKNNEILVISEVQNTSSDLMKLCLTRASEGCKIFIDGDFNSQVDHYSFEGEKNGMKRAIDVFKGEDLFGYINLKNVWRSKIAELADKL